jgi:hypothetical protein
MSDDIGGAYFFLTAVAIIAHEELVGMWVIHASHCCILRFIEPEAFIEFANIIALDLANVD